MKTTNTLRKQLKGYGHWLVSCEIEGNQYSITTNDSKLIDEAFNSETDEDCTWYESIEDARLELVDQIKKKNNL